MEKVDKTTHMREDLKDVVDIEINALLNAIYDRFGYDYRQYSKAHVRRRILNRLKLSGLESVSILQDKVLHDPSFTQLILQDLSINVTEMFRDPDFFVAVREIVIPILKTWSFIKIWHAGCSTGEEVYSMAIILHEEGLLHRTQIYATDVNHDVLSQAREGIYSIENVKKYAQNYQLVKPKAEFSDYYHARYDSAIIDSRLKKSIVWADHNLVTDSDFAETQMIICRNVLIYFNKELQNKVCGLFHSSLVNGGLLCLGSKESLRYTDFHFSFDEIDTKRKIYKKMYL